MDRTAFGRKTSNNQLPRTDRFVNTREEISTYIHRRWMRRRNCDHQNDDIWFRKYLQRKKYTSYLNEAFGLEALSSQIILKPEQQSWPCRPRNKSYLCSADSILDLPSYSDAAYLLDWSNDNVLVAALGRKYHKWCWGSQSRISQGLAQHRIQCCKFDPRGELLALGTVTQVEIHDHKLSKRVGMTRCQCMAKNYLCSITTLDWSPTGNSYATGCSWGVVVSFSRATKLISWRHVVRDNAVLLVRISPDARYVAVAGVNSPDIELLSWPGLDMHSTLQSKSLTTKTITWHPWRSALLGVGVVTVDNRALISLWNAPSSKIRQRTIGHRRHSIDAMLFSHRTGELVLSLRNIDSGSIQKPCSQLVVMSDPDTVVDRWGEGRSGLDHVRTMVFSADGTKLGTATSDEDLIIWNFLPEDCLKNKKYNCKRFSAIPVYLDETTYGFSLR